MWCRILTIFAKLINFFELYGKLADSWQLYNNSNREQLMIIAAKTQDDKIYIKQNDIWQEILETYKS
jgi:hypothetical protein